ncbi:MAG: hypothetical protein ABI197_04440 [Granulicella sp.]
MPYRTCQHIKLDGILCGSPALNRKLYCYYHQRVVSRHRRYPGDSPGPNAVTLDPIGDRIDLQMSLSQVISALAIGYIDPKRAMVLLKALKMVSRNLAALENILEL